MRDRKSTRLNSSHRTIHSIPTRRSSDLGVNSLYNSNNVDGANNNNSYNAGARGVGGTVVGTPDGYVYSSDSIREFQVASSSYSAEIGQAAGGSVNARSEEHTSELQSPYDTLYPYTTLFRSWSEFPV